MRKINGLLSLIALSFLLTVLVGCAETITADFENLVISSAVDEEFYPTNSTSIFQTTSPIVYLTGKIVDAEIGMVITADWYYLGQDENLFIYGMELTVDKTELDFYFSLTKPTNNWLIGNYEIKLFIGEKLIDTVTFKVE